MAIPASALLTPSVLTSVGWVATAVFACSYFATKPVRLRMIQAVAALMWVAYGLLIHAMPVVVANVIVAVAAVYSSLRPESGATEGPSLFPATSQQLRIKMRRPF